MSLYSNAVAAIVSTREAKQAELDAAARHARVSHLQALRSDLRDVSDTPLAAIRNLLAESITIGREDGFPQYNVPEAVKQILVAAAQSGILVSEKGQGGNLHYPLGSIAFHYDFSEFKTKHALFDADYLAWAAAKDYREAQKVNF